MAGRDRLLQLAGRLGVGPQRIDRVHPVQRVQVVEVHDVVMDLQVQLHDVADRVGVVGDGDPQRILDRAHEVSAWVPVQTPQIRSVKAQASRGSRPFRITSSPRHIVPVRHRVADDALLVDVDLAAHVAFDPA